MDLLLNLVTTQLKLSYLLRLVTLQMKREVNITTIYFILGKVAKLFCIQNASQYKNECLREALIMVTGFNNESNVLEILADYFDIECQEFMFSKNSKMLQKSVLILSCLHNHHNAKKH